MATPIDVTHEKQLLLASREKLLGYVRYFKLGDGSVYTPDSPVTVPVNVRPHKERKYRLTFACDAGITNGITVVLPPGVAKGQSVIFVPAGGEQTVRIRRGVPHQVPIPYSVYYDERTLTAQKSNVVGSHGFAESNSPPAMHVGP
jgi:hypothetical protein